MFVGDENGEAEGVDGKWLFWGCARPFVPNNEEQKVVDRYCWMDQPAPPAYVGVKWALGGDFHGIDPRK
jgi:hypothetical protein